MIEQALKLAIKTSYLQVTATELAAACGTTRQTVHSRFGTRESLQAVIVQEAFDNDCRVVMAQAAACNHPLAKDWAVSIQPKSRESRAACGSTTTDL